MNKQTNNQKIATIFRSIGELLDIKGETVFRIKAYQKVADSLEKLSENILVIYHKKGIKGIESISGIGKSSAEKIEEYLKKKKISFYEKLKKETAIRQVITHYFETKNISLQSLKKQAKKKQIIYARYTRPAKELLELTNYSITKAKKSIKTVADWANSRDIDYTIDTVIKKWLELDKLKPKKLKKKAFYEGQEMREKNKKWFVITANGEWLEFADKKDKIEWKIVK